MTAHTPWLQTRSGRKFPLIDPCVEHVYWPDVIYALAHTNRFGGHVGHYSVAQHSCLVADQLRPEWRLYGLLHDAHEAYVGDIATPLKRALGANRPYVTAPAMHQLDHIVRGIDFAIYSAADLCYPVPQEIDEAVHIADRRAIVTERRDLHLPPPESWGEEYEKTVPLPEPIVRWNTQQTIARFAGALMDAGLAVPLISFVG